MEEIKLYFLSSDSSKFIKGSSYKIIARNQSLSKILLIFYAIRSQNTLPSLTYTQRKYLLNLKGPIQQELGTLISTQQQFFPVPTNSPQKYPNP